MQRSCGTGKGDAEVIGGTAIIIDDAESAVKHSSLAEVMHVSSKRADGAAAFATYTSRPLIFTSSPFGVPSCTEPVAQQVFTIFKRWS